MKAKYALTVGLLAILTMPVLAADQAQPGVKSAPVKPTKMSKRKTYKCPMDGTISHKPGKCAKCGAELVQISPAPGTKKAPLEQVTYRYRCPMDGTISDAPGKCPKCGMDMQKERAGSSENNKG
jgi:hypothetical protein